MEISISTIPVSIAAVREVAVAAERHGISRLGIADSPHLFGATYPAVQDALAATTRLRIGPFVTNPVTMHASVHAANLAALLELHPGRVALAMGVGDSAVTSVGLPVASREELRSAICSIREALGDRVFIEMAVSGPRAAGAVPPEVDGVTLGSGLSAPYARSLRERAEQAAGKPLKSRVVLVGNLVAHESEIAAASRGVRASAFAYARHGIGRDLEKRDVPAHLRNDLLTVIDGYRMDAHAQVGGSNAALLDRYPEITDYLVHRYALVGEPQELADRIVRFGQAAGIDGVSISVNVPDPIAQVIAIGDELLPRVARLINDNQQ